MASDILIFTGGLAETNAYLLKTEKGHVAIDAPEGFAAFTAKRATHLEALILTHGHWDHIWDAAAIAKKFQCPVYYHADDSALITNPDIMRAFGLPVRLEPVAATRHLMEGDMLDFSPWAFSILHVPGHCPGSICLYSKDKQMLFGGDVLFAGGVGRWDLPGGNSRELLISGIKNKLLPLGDGVQVLPGHGSDTTIGEERLNNPYLE